MRSAVCSLIVSASNRLEPLAVAVASARMQLAAGVEALVLDDGASRGIPAWLAQRGMEWPALRTVKTGGPAPARARLDRARAGVSRPVRRYASAARAGSRAFMRSTQAKAASVSAALNFASAYGAGK